MERKYPLVLTLGVALILIVVVSAAASDAQFLGTTASSAAELAAEDCSSDPLPQVVRVDQDEILAAGLLYLVKGPTAIVADTFPETIWQEAFEGSPQTVALVSPDQDTIWPPEDYQSLLLPESVDTPDIGSIFNAWQVLQGWRAPFLMLSGPRQPIDIVSLGMFEADWLISAQALDHLNLQYEGELRHAWVYLVREDGQEQLLGQLEVADPAFISITVPERGEVQLRTHDSTIWWVQCFPPPSVTITKTADPDSWPEPGGMVDYTVLVGNPGTLPLILKSLSDDVYGDIADEANPLINSTTCVLPQSLPVGRAYACSFVGGVFGNAGHTEVDTVLATGMDQFGRVVTATATAKVVITDVLPTITVEKIANPTRIDEPGGKVDFAVRVNNTAPEELVLTLISDDIYGNITSGENPLLTGTTCSVPQTIPIGSHYTCSFGAMLSGNPGDSQTDTITAIAQDDEGNAVSEKASATVLIDDVPSVITVTKTADPSHVPEPGDDVQFAVTVKNGSEVDAVTITSIMDDRFGDITDACYQALPALLSPGEQITCSFTRYIGGDPGDTHTNVVTAFGTDDDGHPVTDQDSAVVIIDDVPSVIEVIKEATPYWMYYPGGNVTFELTVHNHSEVDFITLETLNDSAYGNVDGQNDCSVPQTMEPGSTYRCTFSADVFGEPDTNHTNIITAAGTDDDGKPVSDQDSAVVTIAAKPTSVDLLYFRASAEGRRVVVAWATAWERENWGFNLYRSQTPAFAEATSIHFEHAQSSGQFEGWSYQYEDTATIPGEVYYYWLQDVALAGGNTFGPVQVFTPHRIYLPLTSR